jgi:AcrR family transcriptional regulator
VTVKKKAKKSDPFARLRENAPQQQRSLMTLRRLLDAAETLLAQGGLDAATVPAIAERAGVSVGIVYRRFPDKDTLLRAVYQRFFERVREANRIALEGAWQTMKLTLPDLLRAMIAGMAEGYRRNRNVLRALTLYAVTHRDADFRRAAREMNREALTAIAALLVSHRSQIEHPNPEEAIEIALLAVASLLRMFILEEEPLHSVRSPQDLDSELTRLVFAYLGIRERATRSRGRRASPDQ